tara:strand:+ start:59 stop:577 length:519 start_codon:yes stop_codon:yes gene_type:complete
MIEKLQSVDIDIIKSELEILPKFKTIICLQCSKETKETSDAIIDPRYPGMKNYLKEKYNTTFDPNDFKYPLFDMPYINSIMESLKMVNSRVLNLKTTACHIYHQDKSNVSPRINIPIITNENCWLIINKEIHHLPAGYCYLVDTTQWHTSVNASSIDRWSIIGDVTELEFNA